MKLKGTILFETNNRMALTKGKSLITTALLIFVLKILLSKPMFTMAESKAHPQTTASHAIWQPKDQIHKDLQTSSLNSLTAKSVISEPTCRNEGNYLNHYLPVSTFECDSCARCYSYMPRDYFYDNVMLTYMENYPCVLWDMVFEGNSTKKIGRRHKVNLGDTDSYVYSTFRDDLGIRFWEDCCRAARKCCQGTISAMKNKHLTDSSEYYETELSSCPATWDGWQCFPETMSDTTATQPCPHYIYFSSEAPGCTALAFKKCESNGTWYQEATYNGGYREKTDYTGCGKSDLMKSRIYVHVGAYSISILALIPAIIIFHSYKQLRVHRITLHKNMFCSLLLNGLSVILFKLIVIVQLLDVGNDVREEDTIVHQNGITCKIGLIVTKYARCATYMWMFSEGYYLHKLIAAAFAEQKRLTMYYLIGWVLPLFPTGIYAALRVTTADENCWVVPVNSYEWVFNSLNLLALVLNFVFLCNIIRVLVTKLRATHSDEPSQYRKAVRATLILVPLFGCHFFVTIYRPTSGQCEMVEAYFYTNYLLEGLQGFLVSLIFCYLNGEVTYLLKRTYWRCQMSRSGLSENNNPDSALNRHRRMKDHRYSTTYMTSLSQEASPRISLGKLSRINSANHSTKVSPKNGPLLSANIVSAQTDG